MLFHDKDLIEKTVEQNVVFDGRVITVRNDTVVLSDGREAKREIVAHNGGVCVAVIDEDDFIYFVRQFRIPYNEILLELPAGKLEKGEDPYEAGIREAREETGAIIEKMSSLGKIYPTPGYCGEKIHLYYAEKFTMGESQLDDGEFLNVIRIKFDTAVKMVLDGEITDGKTQTAILKLAFMRGQKNA